MTSNQHPIEICSELLDLTQNSTSDWLGMQREYKVQKMMSNREISENADNFLNYLL